MDCPNCGIREMALMQAVEALVGLPDGSDRLWCPHCGFVHDRPVVVKAPERVSKVPVKRVPRGTSVAKAAMKKLGGRTIQKGGKR